MCTSKGIANIKHWQCSLVLFSVSPSINEPLTNCNNVCDWMLLHRRKNNQKEYNIIYVHKDIEMNGPCNKGSVMFLKKKLGFVTGVVQWYARRV
jgi:hypothetical protein